MRGFDDPLAAGLLWRGCSAWKLRAVVFFSISSAIALGSLLATSASADGADEPRGDRVAVRLRFVGADKNTPLAGLHVEVTQGHGSDQKKFGPFKTDDTGTADVMLAPGFYSLHLQADKELPYLPVEALWNKRSRTTRPDLSLAVRKSGTEKRPETRVEKWLDGKRRDDGYEPPANAGDAPRITYTLLRACELTLRAVDAEAGKGLPGAEFYTENAVGEDWGHPIENDTIQVKHAADVKPSERRADVTVDSVEVTEDRGDVTDKKGNFRRLVSANANYKYGVAKAPAGYVPSGPAAEVEIDVLYGQRSATHVFKFRRK